MRGRLWWSAGVGLSCLGACHARPATSTAPAAEGATIQQIPLAPVHIEEPTPKPKLTSSIVDDERPHAFDGHLKNPGMATLRGISEREAWLACTVIEGESYDAIVNLETGCVVETFPGVQGRQLATRVEGANDGEVITRLMSEDVQRAVGAHLALLARFDLNESAAVMVRTHSDGDSAVSADRRKLAVTTRGRVYLSIDGGRSFARADGDSGGVEALQFSAGDRYLVYASYSGRSPKPKRELAILDTMSPLTATKVNIEGFTPLRVSSPEGLLLFTRDDERCIYGVDPAAATMKQLSCVAGPQVKKGYFFYVSLSPSGRTGMELQGDFQATRGIMFAVDGKTKPRTLKGAYELHNAHVGPDDEGRFAWENHYDVLRIDSPEGIRDTRMNGTPLGFDLQGNVLIFQQPALVRPHKPMTMMPPAKGTLEDNRCTLIRRVPSKSPKKIPFTR